MASIDGPGEKSRTKYEPASSADCDRGGFKDSRFKPTVKKTFFEKLFGGATPDEEPEADVPPNPKLEMDSVNGFKHAKIPLFEYVPPSWGFVKIACCADLHNNLQNIKIPDGDILLIAGDFTLACSDEELKVFDEAVGKLPHAYKVAVLGYHEIDHLARVRRVVKNCTILEGEAITIRGITIFGCCSAPGAPENLQCDVLLTHWPPRGYGLPLEPGDANLWRGVAKFKPVAHVFGGNHASGGKSWISEHTIFINAACCVGGAIGTRRRPGISFDFAPFSFIEVNDHIKKSKFEKPSADLVARAKEEACWRQRLGESDSEDSDGEKVSSRGAAAAHIPTTSSSPLLQEKLRREKDNYLLLMAKTKNGEAFVRKIP